MAFFRDGQAKIKSQLMQDLCAPQYLCRAGAEALDQSFFFQDKANMFKSNPEKNQKKTTYT